MELNEFIENQWYCSNYKNCYFQFIKIGQDKNKSIEYIEVRSINADLPNTYKHEDWFSNKDYFSQATPILFKDIPKKYQELVPEEYRKPREYLPLIFN